MRNCLIALIASTLPALALADDAVRMTGRYAHGKQVSLFEPCGAGEEALWVLEDGAAAERLIAAHVEVTTDAYEGVYAEIDAVRGEAPAGAGIPQEYDAVLRVTVVYELRGRLPPDCL